MGTEGDVGTRVKGWSGTLEGVKGGSRFKPEGGEIVWDWSLEIE